MQIARQPERQVMVVYIRHHPSSKGCVEPVDGGRKYQPQQNSRNLSSLLKHYKCRLVDSVCYNIYQNVLVLLDPCIPTFSWIVIQIVTLDLLRETSSLSQGKQQVVLMLAKGYISYSKKDSPGVEQRECLRHIQTWCHGCNNIMTYLSKKHHNKPNPIFFDL